MKDFWVVTYMDDNDQIRRQRFDDEDAARSAWYNYHKPIFLDHVRRYESNI